MADLGLSLSQLAPSCCLPTGLAPSCAVPGRCLPAGLPAGCAVLGRCLPQVALSCVMVRSREAVAALGTLQYAVQSQYTANA